jgi:hypothetical protein
MREGEGNTLLIVLLELRTARALEGRRRVRAMQAVAGVWTVGLLIVAAAGTTLKGTAAAALMVIPVVLWSAGECVQGAWPRWSSGSRRRHGALR